jgi:hypothetical protein
LYEMHALLPRLGLFAADPTAVPYDYGELLEAIAPRPTLLYTPTGDRDATFLDVRTCIEGAAKAWSKVGAADKLVHQSPEAITKMEGTETKAAVDWLKSLNATSRGAGGGQ